MLGPNEPGEEVWIFFTISGARGYLALTSSGTTNKALTVFRPSKGNSFNKNAVTIR